MSHETLLLSGVEADRGVPGIGLLEILTGVGAAARVIARRLARILQVIVFGLLPVALLALFVVDVPVETYAWDFHAFWHAAKEAAHGGDLYSSPGVNSVGRRIPEYVYPPLLAELLVALGVLPFLAAAIVFIGLSVLALAGALWLLDVRDWRCYGVTLLWFPTLHAFRLGALTPILVLGIAVSWHLRRSRYEPVPLMATLALKLFLWPLVFWYAAQRDGRKALRAVLILIGLVLIPWALIGFAGLRRYPARLRHAQDQWAPSGYGAGTLLHVWGVPNAVTDVVLVSLALVVSAAAAYAIRTRRLGEAEGLTVLLGVALVFSPVVWMHYLTLLVVPLALLRPTLGIAWFVPLLLWLTPSEESLGRLTRIGTAMAVVVVTIAVSLRGRGDEAADPRTIRSLRDTQRQP